MTVHSTDADALQSQAAVDESATALETEEINEEVTADN